MRAGRANRQRGEIEAVMDGERRILCMTLGALGERTVVPPSLVVKTTPAFVASAIRLANLSSIV